MAHERVSRKEEVEEAGWAVEGWTFIGFYNNLSKFSQLSSMSPQQIHGLAVMDIDSYTLFDGRVISLSARPCRLVSPCTRRLRKPHIPHTPRSLAHRHCLTVGNAFPYSPVQIPFQSTRVQRSARYIYRPSFDATRFSFLVLTFWSNSEISYPICFFCHNHVQMYHQLAILPIPFPIPIFAIAIPRGPDDELCVRFIFPALYAYQSCITTCYDDLSHHNVLSTGIC